MIDNRREIPGFEGRYFLGDDGTVWSYWPQNPSGDPWYQMRGRGGTTVRLTRGLGQPQLFTNLSEIVSGVAEGREPRSVKTLSRDERIEMKLDAIMERLGISEGDEG
jgi:hypothetical protein